MAHYDSECDTCNTALSIHSDSKFLRLLKPAYRHVSGKEYARSSIEVCGKCNKALHEGQSLSLWQTDQTVALKDVTVF